MRLERLELANFRSYNKKTFHFADLTVVVGPNARGKTNILEAIQLLSTGISFRAKLTEEMIRFGSEIGNITGIVEHQGERVSLGVVLTPGVYLGKRISKRRYLVDGAMRTRAKFVGRLLTVVFRPEDLRLVEGSPARRRAFLDDILVQANTNYARALTAYEGALRRRNKILDQIREGQARREQLAFWDATMIKNGNIVTEMRRELLLFLSEEKANFGSYSLEYDASTISSARLKKYEMEEVAAGYTLVGPHKDDFVIIQNNSKKGAEIGGGKDLMKYGSRGEQRLAVLFMKLGTLNYVEHTLKIKPLLLLDDIFSELDEEHRGDVMEMTRGRQTIITTAETQIGIELPGADMIKL